MAEYGAFKVLLGMGLHRTVDPMWLGLLLMVGARVRSLAQLTDVGPFTGL